MPPTPSMPSTPIPPTGDSLVGVLLSLGNEGIALALTVLSMTAGVAAFITQQLLKGKIDRLEDQVKQLKTTNDGNLESAKKEYAELNAKYEAILHHGAMIRAELQEIVKVAGEIATRVGANAYSVLVPAPASIAGDKPNDLVFLFASGPQAAELRWIRLRVGEENLAGKVYRSGQATIASPSDFAKSVDKITDYKTKEILAVCLRDLTGPVGVAQFLNKHNDEQFTPKDKELAENHCTALTPLVATFTKDPRRLIEMGHAPRRNQIDATIMLVDLSHYKELFSDGMDNSVITDWLNQYFEKLCKIAMQHGGEIDQFVGDGVLLTFTHPQDADRAGAFDAAVKMRDAFRKLREGWMGLGYSKTATLFVRIGLSCGLVTPEDVGYGHARRSTVIGPAVNNAADACQSGSRDRDMIILTKAMKQALDKHSKLDGAQVNWENNFFQVLG